MALDFQVISLSDLDEIATYANQRLAAAISDETERRFASWAVKWRGEALEHYLRLGWSFVARREARTVGFFLAQPFLFVRGQTQTLWLEYIDADDRETLQALLELATKLSREKHLQRVLIADAEQDKLVGMADIFKGELMRDSILEVKTTKG